MCSKLYNDYIIMRKWVSRERSAIPTLWNPKLGGAKMWTVVHLLLICCSCFLSSQGRSLSKGQVAYKIDLTSLSQHTILVTNGAFVVKATVSNVNNDITSCRVISSTEKAQKIMRHKKVILETVGEDQIAVMLEQCQQLRRPARDAGSSRDDDKTFNKNILKDKPFSGDPGTGAPSGAGSHMAIFPGTKWCGYENVAENMDDLGVHRETDSCCRTHDHCPYFIDRFESKFHYYNAYPWTISYCECDQHLFDCLKKVNTSTANQVGELFFGMLKVQCFTFQQGEYCADSSSVLSKLWCHHKSTGMRAVMQTFGHKWGETDEDADIVG